MRLSSLRKYAFYICLSCLLSYFIYHMIEGERGLRAWGRLKHQLQENQTELATLEKKRKLLEKKISLLGDQVDLDLLDQQVRQFLEYSRPEETIIFW